MTASRYLGALTLLFLSWVHAAEVSLIEGQTTLIKISKHEPTALKLKNAQLATVDRVKGEADVRTDAATATIYLQPLVDKPINLFLTTTSGKVFTLLATQEDTPSQMIYLVDKSVAPLSGWLSQAKDERTAKVIELIEKFLLNQLDGLEVQSKKQRIRFWKNTELELVASVAGDGLIAEKFSLKNTAIETLVFEEREFFRPDVVAVAATRTTLKAGQVADLVVVRAEADK